MAYCTNCGQELVDGAHFCSNCGVGTNGQNNRRTVYDGAIHKCPNCGELLKSYVTNCPSCGYEIRSVNYYSSVNELANKIEKAVSVDEKIELITNFYIPNTKEDIFDFFILAVSNLEDDRYETDDAWRAKLEQAYHKARITLDKSPEFDYIDKLYHNTLSKLSRKKGSNFIRKHQVACLTALLITLGIIMLIVGIVMMSLISFEDNWGGAYCGLMLIILGINLLISPSWAIEGIKKSSNRNGKVSTRDGRTFRSVGKSYDAFIRVYYEDVVEQLKELGFKNIVIKAEKKGFLDEEGAIKSISIAGNSEFKKNEEFDINSKIIIRYYSRKV